MPEYDPPPKDLTRLNPIQRYMQKGSLEKQDYAWLFILVLAYFTVRPYLQELAKRFFSPDTVEGERIHQEYIQTKAKAKIGPNAIRGTDHQELETIPESKEDVTTSGTQTTSKGKAINRKNKEKSLQDQLLDWDDEPARPAEEPGKADVVSWLDKWSKESEE
jgi:hypothetical protein